MLIEKDEKKIANQSEFARNHILKELVDALIQENLFSIQDHATLSEQENNHPDCELEKNEKLLLYPLNGGHDKIVFRVVEQEQLQPYRLSRPPVLLVPDSALDHAKVLDAADLMHCLVNMADSSLLPNISGLDRFLHDLAIAEAQTCWVLEHAWKPAINAVESNSSDLLRWERLASLRDRPFHPLARAKTGWGFDQYRCYGAETSHVFGLSWLAVRSEFVVGNSDIFGFKVADAVLSPGDRVELEKSLSALGITAEQYTLVPVHPWHLQHVVLEKYGEYFEQKGILLVSESLGRFTATSSVRSLAAVDEAIGDYAEASHNTHLKLPLAISSLGALRILPFRYLHNGFAAQSLLESVIDREECLRDRNRCRVICCDESQWLGFSPNNESMLSDQNGHLSCLLRQYPASIGISEKKIPMSAFTVRQGGSVPALEFLSREKKQQNGLPGLVLEFYSELCEKICTLCFTCFQYGIMPEVHGQNIVLLVNEGNISGLLLRDHDTLRIFPPWLRQANLSGPDYIMDWSTPNSLVCLSPQELLRYFQTLGVQVNLFSIADNFSQAYGLDIRLFWDAMQKACQQQLQDLELSDFVKAILRKELLDNPRWPTRLLLTPYLVKRGRKMGMPAGVGSIRNPLMECF